MISEERQILASELAMGLLEGADEIRAERLRRDDPEFDSAVWWWEEHLAGCLAGVAEVAAPAAALDGVKHALFGREQATKAKRGFRWKPVVGGIVGVKAALFGAYMGSRALNTETYVVETRYGEATISWNARAGSLSTRSNAHTTLHIWKRTSDGFSYLGSVGQKLAVGLTAGEIIILSADGPLSTDPEPLVEQTLVAD